MKMFKWRPGLLALPLVAAATLWLLPPGVATAEPRRDSQTEGNSAPQTSAETAKSPTGEETKKHRKKRKKRRKKRRSHQPTSSVEVSSRMGAGYVHGRKTRSFDSAQLAAGLRVKQRHRLGDWSFKLPISLEHLEPISEPIPQTTGTAGFSLGYGGVRFIKPQVGARILGVWRPAWPDLYQPQPDGSLARTDRHSYWKREGRLGLLFRPFDKNHARLRYRYSIKEYRQDPNFEPVERPVHLTPDNSVEHSLTATWRTYFGKHNIGASLEVYRRHYPFTFARDRYTGLTHANPGGLPPNPLQDYLGWVPELFGKWKLSRHLVLRPSALVTINRDEFQGYYSFVEPELGLRLSWHASKKVRLRLGLEASQRNYGPDSYREGSNHPALDYGSRRRDSQRKANIDVSYALTPKLSLLLENEVVVRRTNFPDYEPGVFPAGAAYDIDWDYASLSAMSFVRYHFDALEP